MNKTIAKYMALPMLLSLAFFSCATDESDLPMTDTEGLYITPQVAGSTATRAVAGDNALNENALSHIDVFIGKNGDFTTFHKRFSGSLATTEGRLRIAGQDWKNTFPSTGYDIYLIANATEDLSSITSLSTLKAKTQTDTDIYKTYSATDNSSKTFLMDGVYSGWTPSAAESDIVTVEMNRAAAKIVVNFTLSNDMTTKYATGSAQWKYSNYATTAAVLASGQGTLAAGTATTGNTSLSGSSSGTITTYSDPCAWTGSDDAPYLLVNVPLTNKSDNTVKAQNWYRIPVRDVNTTASDGKQLDRNHIYYVNAVIASEGSSTEIANDQDVLLKYNVIDWATENIDVDAAHTDYLFVTPTLVYMRNIATDNSIDYYASGDIEVVNKEVYYYDENGAKQTYTDASLVTLTPTPSSTGSTNGSIAVSSPIPDETHAGSGTASNLSAGKFTVRFIKFRVRLKSNTSKYQDVLIKQYPLEYIQNIAGWYSTRTTSGWIDWQTDQTTHTTKKTWMDYTNIGDRYYSSTYGYYYSPTGMFVAKVSSADNAQIYAYYDKSSYSYNTTIYNATAYQNTSLIGLGYNVTFEGLKNNHMYVIQIASTSDKYTISHPNINSSTHLSNDDVASPAFMLASQLGGVTTFSSASAAATHCSTYREVDRNGKKYDGWRLPTPSEIGVIVDYQKTSSGAPITAVLTGHYYWTLDGGKTDTGYTDNTNTSVRCVRDLTPAEVAELDKNKQ